MTLAERIELAKTQIKEDAIDNCFDPASIKTFSELHDFVDANRYGFTPEEWSETDGATVAGFIADDCVAANQLQDALDAWIKGGGLADSEELPDLTPTTVGELLQKEFGLTYHRTDIDDPHSDELMRDCELDSECGEEISKIVSATKNMLAVCDPSLHNGIKTNMIQAMEIILFG